MNEEVVPMKILCRKFLALLFIVPAFAAMTACSTVGGQDDFGPKHKVVIQVSTDDPRTQKIALNNAVNVQKAYGVDNVAVEIVAYGPGLSMLTTKNEQQAKRVASLAVQGITFSGCGNTIKGVTKKTGKTPQLIEGVVVVPAGVERIIELQEQGYAYIRP
jgi:intracellular sulfur oxidation DsrE/DsrF family protein